MSRKQLIQEIKEGTASGGLTALVRLFDELSIECHESIETCSVEDFKGLQGEVRGYRKLQRLLTKKSKTK